jgi:U1 small nuclear ribonucleoprotein
MYYHAWLTLHTTDDPQEDREAVGDPYRTLFISRLSFAATEEDLRREFNMYGPIERIRLVREKTGKKKGKSRGYAFILYEREKDMKGELSVIEIAILGC